MTLPDSSLETHGWADPAGEFGEHLCVGREEIHVVAAGCVPVIMIRQSPRNAFDGGAGLAGRSPASDGGSIAE